MGVSAQAEPEDTEEFERKDGLGCISMSGHGLRIGDTFVSASVLVQVSYINVRRSFSGREYITLDCPRRYFDITIPDSCTAEQFLMAYEDWLAKYH